MRTTTRRAFVFIGALMLLELAFGIDLGTLSLAAAIVLMVVLTLRKRMTLPLVVWLVAGVATVVVLAVAIESVIYHHGAFLLRLHQAFTSPFGL